jgi:predicted NUDIX family NTP pyrophosphohydrolase
MSKKSAGLLVYKFKNDFLEVFLVHPGGPFWKNKDEGANFKKKQVLTLQQSQKIMNSNH